MIKRLVYNRKPSTFLQIPSEPVKLSLDLKDVDLSEGVILGSVLEELLSNQVVELMKSIGEKLPVGATILASGSDCSECCRLFVNEEMDTLNFNRLVMSGRQSSWSLVTIADMMSQIGVSANYKKLGGFGNVEYYYCGTKR